ANLDAALRADLRVELAALVRRLGVTAVFVTHDQAEAMTMGDRIAVLSAGRLQQIGTPRAIYERPSNRFVATFLGTPPMNVIEAKVEGGVAHVGAASVPAPATAEGAALLGFRPEHASLAVADAPTGDDLVL